MKIIPNSPGIWQAGPFGICTEEHLCEDPDGVYIETLEPLEAWSYVFSCHKQVHIKHGRFLSIGQGFPPGDHILESDRENSAKLSFGLNIPLLIEMANRFVKEGEEIQHHFPVGETEEYTLQADFEAYFHEVHSSLFQDRSLRLKELPEDGIAIEKERVHLTHELEKNLAAQADLLDIIVIAAERDSHLSPALLPFAEAAKRLSRANRDVNEASFKIKMDTWLPLLKKYGWRPIFIGTPEKIEPLLNDLYTL